MKGTSNMRTRLVFSILLSLLVLAVVVVSPIPLFAANEVELQQKALEELSDTAPTPFQAKLLQDGAVSWDEYESAVRQTSSCIEAPGLTIERAMYSREVARLELTTSRPVWADIDDSQVISWCKERFLNNVAYAYGLLHGRTEAEVQRAHHEVVQCLLGREVDLAAEATPENVAELVAVDGAAMRILERCVSEVDQMVAVER